MTEAPPPWLRVGLRPFSWLYGGVVAARNALFDAGRRRVERLGVPVISVGNLTVGGTGKTPLVMWLVAKARALGASPGVLARGYGRQSGAALNEEGEMLAARFPGLLQVQNPDRVAGGAELVAAGARPIVLDDGFQHRRLHRDVNLLCVDARLAPADRALLPAGRLRESLGGMRRADAVVLTRADVVTDEALERGRQQVLRWVGRDVPVFAAAHRPRDLVAKPDGGVVALDTLRGARVGLVSAIARPAAFEETVRELGAEVAWHHRWRDHHRFAEGDLERAAAQVDETGVRLVVTEKDEPKLAGWATPRWVLRIDLQFLGAEPSAEFLGLA